MFYFVALAHVQIRPFSATASIYGEMCIVTMAGGLGCVGVYKRNKEAKNRERTPIGRHTNRIALTTSDFFASSCCLCTLKLKYARCGIDVADAAAVDGMAWHGMAIEQKH